MGGGGGGGCKQAPACLLIGATGPYPVVFFPHNLGIVLLYPRKTAF